MEKKDDDKKLEKIYKEVEMDLEKNIKKIKVELIILFIEFTIVIIGGIANMSFIFGITGVLIILITVVHLAWKINDVG